MKLDPLWPISIALAIGAGVGIWMMVTHPKVLQMSPSRTICAPTGPTADCIPRERLANLPPDPGREGEKTLGGIDSDGDGVRDDVQRYIALNWGHSERAVRALSGVAKAVQMEVLTGDSVSRYEAKRLAEKFVMNPVNCFSRSVDAGVVGFSALEQVVKKVANTPERSRRKHSFEYSAAHQIYELSDAPVEELCGYDPATLPN